MSKGSVFSRLSPLVDAPTDPSSNPPVDAPTEPQPHPSVVVPTDPQVSKNAQEEQQCDQATTETSSEGWETVKRKKNGTQPHPSVYLQKLVLPPRSLCLPKGRKLQLQLMLIATEEDTKLQWYAHQEFSAKKL